MALHLLKTVITNCKLDACEHSHITTTVRCSLVHRRMHAAGIKALCPWLGVGLRVKLGRYNVPPHPQQS